ncbi:MAG: hypothetical protein LBC53_05460 [Spirochaetaceae bacterium]|jgi:hypothetical protein|nr:hypothetical protein [Spirochaetaceae bacterium]
MNRCNSSLLRKINKKTARIPAFLIFFTAFFSFFASPAIFSQEEGAQIIFAPFVSALKAELMGNAVMLSWNDSKSIKGPVYIYRSREPFYGGSSSNQFYQAQAPYGVQTYNENIENGKWYYLIVASDESGQKYEMVVPFNNMAEVFVDGGARTVNATSWAVQQTTPQIYSYAQAAEGRPNPQSFQWAGDGMAAGLPYVETAQSPITGISASPYEGGVIVQFITPDTGKNAILYRAISPIRKFGDLLVASVVKLNVVSPFVDRVTPGIPYYYAVIYEEDLMNGQAVLSPGANTTLMPVESPRVGAPPVRAGGGIYQPVAPQTPQAPTPLPQGQTMGVSVIPSSQASSSGAAPQVINGGGISTIRAPNSVTPQNYTPNSNRLPLIIDARVFNEDLQKRREGSDEALLADIVQRSIMWRNWAEAKVSLKKFLADKPRSGAVEKRAHFYLGECAYFLGLYREALSEFVSIQSVYPDEAASWVQASLAKIGGR